MNQIGIIYLLINNITQKPYIGQTIDFDERMKAHKNANSKHQLLHKSIRTHGWENFSVIKLHEGVSIQDLSWLEKHCISEWNSMNPNGYNLKYGGNTGIPSEETKKKISKRLSGENHPNRRKDVWDDQDKIVKMYNSGVSTGIIAEKYKCNTAIIRRILNKNGIEIRSGNHAKRPDIWNQSNEITKDYTSGLSIKEISSKYKCSFNLIKKVLIENGIFIRNWLKCDAWNYQNEIIEKYQSGRSLSSIANDYNCSHSTIKNILDKNKVDLRDKNETRRVANRQTHLTVNQASGRR